MARKRKSSTTATSNSDTLARVNKLLLWLQIGISVVVLSAIVFVTERVLSPLFGGVATTLYLKHITSVLIISFTAIPLGLLVARRETVLGTLLCVAPTALHWLAIFTTRLGNPILGPILAYVPVLLPVVFSATDALRDLFIAEKLFTVRSFAGIVLSILVLRSQPLWSYIPYSRSLSQSVLLLAIGWMSILIGLLARRASTADARKAGKVDYKAMILPFLATLLAFSQPPLLVRSVPFTHPNGLLRILSSTPSVTGRIVVGEDYTHGFRFLRADHSLLGGVWIDDKYLAKMDEGAEFVRDKSGRRLGESIYSTFVLQEAVRLQERETPQQNALIIGLGVGIAAQAFTQHGLSTTIVEIDPAVYSAARDFFGAPEPSALYIEDARNWVHRQAALSNGTYDIIVHDVFSGGGVPAHLFTSEFWQDLKRILSPDGIIAVNYAGVIGSESSKAVLLTLRQNFGQCRVFHDYKTQVTEEQLISEFINLVFFCSASPRPLTFRAATRADYLSSYLREHVLRDLPDREVRPELILGTMSQEEGGKYLLTDEHNPLSTWQDKGALDHWKVMRNLLPDYVWSTY